MICGSADNALIFSRAEKDMAWTKDMSYLCMNVACHIIKVLNIVFVSIVEPYPIIYLSVRSLEISYIQLLHVFVKIVWWISQSYQIYLSKLLYVFVKVVTLGEWAGMIDLEQVRLCFHAVVHQRLGETNAPNIVHHNSLHHINDDNIYKYSTYSHSLSQKVICCQVFTISTEGALRRPLTYDD